MMATFFSCSHRYQARLQKVNTDSIPGISASQPITIINDQPSDVYTLVYAQGAHKWTASMRQCTDIAVQLLSEELQNRGVRVAIGAEKTLKISVVNLAGFMGFTRITGKLSLKVATGDGYMNIYEVLNATPWTIDRALNGAISLAVIELLKDEKIREYLSD
jgi:hypothetical protein